MRITLSPEVVTECEDFSFKVTKTTRANYEKRGEGKDDAKKRLDHLNAALSEYAVYLYLTDLGFECTKPDFKIYAAKDKTFDADLFLKEAHSGLTYKVHVKSQERRMISYTRGSPSFNFDLKDRVTKMPTSLDILALTIIEGVTVEILDLLPAQDVFRRFIDKPVSEKLRPYKDSIYYNDIVKGLLADRSL